MAPSGHATATTATAATCRATNGSSVDLKLQLELMWQLQIHGGSAATAAVAGVGSDSSSRRASLTSSSSSSLSSAAAEGLKAMDATVGSASSASSKAAADVGSPTGALNLVVPGARSYLGGHSRCSFSSSSNGSKSGLFSGLLAGRMTAEQRNWWQQLQKDLQPLLQGVLSPPLVAGLVAIGIGSNPFLKVIRVFLILSVRVHLRSSDVTAACSHAWSVVTFSHTMASWRLALAVTQPLRELQQSWCQGCVA